MFSRIDRNAFAQATTRRQRKLKPSTIPAKAAVPGVTLDGPRANSTPMQRVLSGAFPRWNRTQRNLLQQRAPDAAPLNYRTKTSSNRKGNMTLAPNSIPARKTPGAFTAIAASGQGLAPSPFYAQNKPKQLSIQNNSLQKFGVSTIKMSLRTPPQGGGTPGFNALMRRGAGHPALVAANR